MQFNFDTMGADELMAFWAKYNRPSRKAAAELLGHNRRGYMKTAETLANYACNKATAIRCREKGDIQAAQIYESCCDLAYDRLPAEARW
jgi:hypothetical protein